MGAAVQPDVLNISPRSAVFFRTGPSELVQIKVWSLQVSTWSVEELQVRLASLDPQMQQEIEEVRQRYQAKRKPILDAIEAKKRQQQKV